MPARTAQLLALVAASTLIATSACKETDPAKPAYWLQLLDDPEQQSEALQNLGKLKAKAAIPELLRRFHEDENLRAPIATTLSEIGDASVVPELVKAIDFNVGSGADKRSRAINRANTKIIEALATFKAKEGVDPAIKLLKAPNPYVRKAACQTLGALGDPRAVAELNRVASEDDNMNIRRTAIEALGDIGSPEAIPVLLRAMFIEQGVSLYPFASFALFQVGPPAVEPLLMVLRGQHEEIKKLAEQLNFEPGALEIKSLEVLGDLRPANLEAEFVELFKKYDKQDDKKFPLRQLAKRNLAMALEKFGTAPSAKLLADALVAEVDFSVREFYALAVNHISVRSVLPQLLKAAEKGDADARRVVIKAYTQLGLGPDLPALEKYAQALKTDKPETTDAVRKVVEREKVRLIAAAECKGDAACWAGKLGDPNPRVREKATYELGRLDARQYLDKLVEQTGDDDEDARRAAIWTMFRFKDPRGIEAMEKTLAEEHGKPDYIRINEELRRLVVFLKWQRKTAT